MHNVDVDERSGAAPRQPPLRYAQGSGRVAAIISRQSRASLFAAAYVAVAPPSSPRRRTIHRRSRATTALALPAFSRAIHRGVVRADARTVGCDQRPEHARHHVAPRLCRLGRRRHVPPDGQAGRCQQAGHRESARAGAARSRRRRRDAAAPLTVCTLWNVERPPPLDPKPQAASTGTRVSALALFDFDNVRPGAGPSASQHQHHTCSRGVTWRRPRREAGGGGDALARTTRTTSLTACGGKVGGYGRGRGQGGGQGRGCARAGAP